MKLKYSTADNFFKNAQPSTLVEEVLDKLAKQREAEGLLDPHRLRMAEDWSYLANQIVGAEIPPRDEYHNP